MDSKIVEEVTVMGRPVRFTYDDVPLEDIELDPDNPRIRYRLQMERNGKSLEQIILAMPEVKELRKDIEESGGLRERVVLQENGAGKLKALEGNCRMVAVHSLHQKDPKNLKWKKVPARIVSKDVDAKQIAVLLLDWHVAGKITWKAHEKAGQVYHMVHNLGMKQDDVAMYMRTSKSTVSRLEQAYRMMKDRFLTIDENKYHAIGEKKWSYFDEFFRQKELREVLKRNPEFGDEFCRWVGEGKLPQPVLVRKLPSIMRHPEALKKFEKGAPVGEALKIVEQAEPEQGSDFFKLLAKMKDSCSNAAQVKEILRIRTDKVARQRLMDTYEALVGFMQLADVDLPDSK